MDELKAARAGITDVPYDIRPLHVPKGANPNPNPNRPWGRVCMFIFITHNPLPDIIKNTHLNVQSRTMLLSFQAPKQLNRDPSTASTNPSSPTYPHPPSARR